MKPNKSNRSNNNSNRTRSMSDPAIFRNRVTFQPALKLEAGSQNESHTDVSPDTLLAREVIPILSSTKLEAGSQNETSQTSEASHRYFQQGGSYPISGSSQALHLPSPLELMPDRRLNSSLPKIRTSDYAHRKNRSHLDNEAGSAEEAAREYVISLPRTKQKLVVPQIKDIPKKIKLKNSKNWDQELWEPGMDAGSQTEDNRSPKGESSISGPDYTSSPSYKRSPAKTTLTKHQQYEELFAATGVNNEPIQEPQPHPRSLKKSNKDLKTTLPREPSPRITKKEAKRSSSAGYKTPSLPKGIEKRLSFGTLPNLEAGSEQQKDFSELSVSTHKLRSGQGGKDFGTTAASIGNDSTPFEIKFENEIAYFQNYDMRDVLISSDTDGSKAISEGSSTAEGAASAAEGYFDIYHYLQNHTNH